MPPASRLGNSAAARARRRWKTRCVPAILLDQSGLICYKNHTLRDTPAGTRRAGVFVCTRRAAPAMHLRLQQFVREYLVDLNAAAAARRCGYPAKSAATRGNKL